MSVLETTEYYDEYIKYFNLAKIQQHKCNLGNIPYADSCMGDDLLENVELYDVVERKFAGFSQIINDVFYGWTSEHPYWHKMEQGFHTRQREIVAKDWTGKHSDFNLAEWRPTSSRGAGFGRCVGSLRKGGKGEQG